eukprot:5214454-Pleurochrysis_carterae.AAC.2
MPTQVANQQSSSRNALAYRCPLNIITLRSHSVFRRKTKRDNVRVRALPSSVVLRSRQPVRTNAEPYQRLLASKLYR